MNSPNHAPGGRRFGSNLVIVLWLCFQIGLPLAYYAGFREDPNDERFAWRMFSPIRNSACNIELYVGGPRNDAAEIALQELHETWLSLMRRGRLRVAERYLQFRCEQMRAEGVEDPWVSMRMICREPGTNQPVHRLHREHNACTPPAP